jgi:hypothetical protein
MIDLGIAILWCALQVSIVMLVAVILCFRPWRIGGVATPLYGLTSVIVVSALTFVPIPGSISAALRTWLSGKLFEERFGATADDESGESLRHLREDVTDGPNSRSDAAAGKLDEASRQDLVLVNESTLSLWELVRTGWGSAQSLAASPESQNGVRSGDLTSNRNRLSLVVWGVFGTGLVFGIARILLGLRGTSQLRRESVAIHDSVIDAQMSVIQARLSLKVRVDVRETTALTTAATFGFLRPLVLLPSHWRSWNSGELQAVLAHELAHVRHNDFVTHLLVQLGVVLHFYNPLIHWLVGRLRLEQELAADATAASVAGGGARLPTNSRQVGFGT